MVLEASLCMANVLKDMRIQNFQNLMWLQAHRCFLKRAFICTLLKFNVQIFRYTLLYFFGRYTCKLNQKLNREKLFISSCTIYISTTVKCFCLLGE